MKFLLSFIFASSFLSATLFATPSSSCVSENNVKSELEYLIQTIHNNHSDHALYASYMNEYNLIVSGINGVYKDAALKIANGYLLRGRQITKKNEKIQSRITYYERRANKLMNDINANIIGPTAMGNMGKWKNLLDLMVQVVDKGVKQMACERAKDFYEESYWRTSDDIFSDSYHINFGFLGRKCSR